MTLVQAYEAVHHPIEAPDPVSAIEFRMEQLGLTRADLERLIGSSGRVSEVLNRRRPLTLRMIRRLSVALDIPADILIQGYPMDRSAARSALTPEERILLAVATCCCYIKA